jgi:hypothetical protein
VGPEMTLSRTLLLAEADRLVTRAEAHVEHYRKTNNASALVEHERELKRLHLYRAVLASSNSAHAIMPEYIVARGLARDAELRSPS